MRSALLAAAVLSLASVAHAEPPADPPDEHGPDVHIRLDTGDDASSADGVSAITKLPPDVRARLTGDQVESILRRSQEAHTASAAAAVVPALFFLTILAIVVAILVGRHRRERVLHETLRTMIERGVDIPKELLGANQKRPPDDRRRGLILSGAGLGLCAFLWAVDRGGGSWAAGLVPLLVGAGYLAAWALERKDRVA